MVSIGFGNQEVIVVNDLIDSMTEEIQSALRCRIFIKIKSVDDDIIYINPMQIKVLQNA